MISSIAVRAAQRRPPLGRVGLQVGPCDEAPVRRHLLLDEARRFSLVEPRGALFSDAGQRARQVRLREHLAGLVGHAVLRELRQRRRVRLHGRQDAGDRRRERLGEREPSLRERDGGLDQALPRQLPVRAPGKVKPGDGPRHAHREMAAVVLDGVVLPVSQEHRRRGRRRRLLAEVVRHGIAGGRAIDDEPSSADVAGGRVHDGQREGRRDGRIDGAAAGLQHVHADRRRGGLLRHDHAVRRAHGLGRGGDRHRSRGGDDGDPGAVPFHRSDPPEPAVSGPPRAPGRRARGRAWPASSRRSRTRSGR